MKLAAPILSLVCLLMATSAQAQLYKSTGPDGKVTYSDTPPATGNVVQKKTANGGSDDSDGLPYELAQAVKNSPVILYTGDKCIPCDDGRKLLSSRGIPFSEKTIKTNDDIAMLQKTTGENHLPVLMVGRSKESSFEAGAWNTALSAAGYPKSNQLPKNYKNAPAAAAAPSASSAKKAATEASSAHTGHSEPLPAAGNAPPGFRF
ncbi:glutaredoxin family protein [Paraherbaspirillum soli]|uniref:Glutaredoxin family protein n=1 Tax=Paraherbaspirillum soli TaxID=631222 RepID=A0ABW0MCX9_9BURK